MQDKADITSCYNIFIKYPKTTIILTTRFIAYACLSTTSPGWVDGVGLWVGSFGLGGEGLEGFRYLALGFRVWGRWSLGNTHLFAAFDVLPSLGG